MSTTRDEAAHQLAENQKLKPYRVTLHEDKGDKMKLHFDCMAEDDDHAAEQALNAYPNGEVLHTGVEPSLVVIQGGKKLPPDPEGMNDERAEWARAALSAFQGACRTDDEDALADMLADLMHWCDRTGMDFAHELERARAHYTEETFAGDDEA